MAKRNAKREKSAAKRSSQREYSMAKRDAKRDAKQIDNRFSKNLDAHLRGGSRF